MYKLNRHIGRLVTNIRRTYRNKLLALAVLAIGILAEVLTNDATVLLVVSILFVVPLLLEKENCV